MLSPRKSACPTGVEVAHFNYTHSLGAGVGDVNLTRLPPGKIRILASACYVATSAFAANADLHIGLRAYTNSVGTAVAEDDNLLLDNADAATGGNLSAGFATLTVAGYIEIDSREGVVVYGMIDTGNIEDTDTIDGFITFTRVG
jgi:hypothetical protein